MTIEINVIEQCAYMRACRNRNRGFAHTANHGLQTVSSRRCHDANRLGKATALHQLEVHAVYATGNFGNVGGKPNRFVYKNRQGTVLIELGQIGFLPLRERLFNIVDAPLCEPSHHVLCILYRPATVCINSQFGAERSGSLAGSFKVLHVSSDAIGGSEFDLEAFSAGSPQDIGDALQNHIHRIDADGHARWLVGFAEAKDLVERLPRLLAKQVPERDIRSSHRRRINSRILHPLPGLSDREAFGKILHERLKLIAPSLTCPGRRGRRRKLSDSRVRPI